MKAGAEPDGKRQMIAGAEHLQSSPSGDLFCPVAHVDYVAPVDHVDRVDHVAPQKGAGITSSPLPNNITIL